MKARILAAIISGLALALTSPPFGLAWMAWFVWVPMFWACRPGEGKRNAKIAYIGGVISTTVIYEWLIGTVELFGGMPWIVGFLVLLVFAAAFSLVYPLVFGTVHWFRTRLGDLWMLATPALWVAFEKLDPSLFPYYQGSTQYRTEATWQFASVLGPTGLSFLIVLTNCILAEALYRRWENRPGPKKALGTMAAVLVLVVGWGSWRAQAIEEVLQEAPILRVGLLQQDVTMEERLSSTSALPATMDWMSQTEQVTPERPDLVLWAEGAIPFNSNIEDEDPMRVPAFCGLTIEEYFEFMAGNGGSGILLDSLERGICTNDRVSALRRLWLQIDNETESEEERGEQWTTVLQRLTVSLPPSENPRTGSQCGFDMLIGAGSRSGDQIFNTAFGISRPPIPCDACEDATNCSDSPTMAESIDLTEAQVRVLGCTIPNWEDTTVVAECLNEQGLTLGSLQGGYDKMIPLPFGEYIPFSETFPALRGSIQGVGDFQAGETVSVFEGSTSDGVAYRYSAPICYEAILERQMWKMFRFEDRDPVDFFVNITNDAWYGVTAGPHQHAMLTAAQAMMYGRPLIRSAYTGISWIVEPHGRILHETDLYEEVSVVVPLRLATVDTLFVRGGWLFPYLCILGVCVAGIVGRRRGMASSEAKSSPESSVTHPDSAS